MRPGRRRRHQPRRQVDRVAEAHERPAHRVPVGAAAQPAVGDADLESRGRRRGLQVEQLERRGGRAGGVVLVGEGRSEDAVQVGALVAEGQLEDVAAVAVEDLLAA